MCESLDGCNVGTKYQRHRHSFLTCMAGSGPVILSTKRARLMAIIVLTHSMYDFDGPFNPHGYAHSS